MNKKLLAKNINFGNIIQCNILVNFVDEDNDSLASLEVANEKIISKNIIDINKQTKYMYYVYWRDGSVKFAR